MHDNNNLTNEDGTIDISSIKSSISKKRNRNIFDDNTNNNANNNQVNWNSNLHQSTNKIPNKFSNNNQDSQNPNLNQNPNNNREKRGNGNDKEQFNNKTIIKKNTLPFIYDSKYWLLTIIIYTPIIWYVFYIIWEQFFRILNVFFIKNDFSNIINEFFLMLVYLIIWYILLNHINKLWSTLLWFITYSILDFFNNKKSENLIWNRNKLNLTWVNKKNDIINWENRKNKLKLNNINNNSIWNKDETNIELDKNEIQYDYLIVLLFFIIIYLSSLIYHWYYIENYLMNNQITFNNNIEVKWIGDFFRNAITIFFSYVKTILLELSIYLWLLGTYFIGYLYVSQLKSTKDIWINKNINPYKLYILTFIFMLLEIALMIYIWLEK